jgi:hypothetical protein
MGELIHLTTRLCVGEPSGYVFNPVRRKGQHRPRSSELEQGLGLKSAMIEYLEELKPSRRLVVAFTGVGHGLSGLPFDFHRSVSGLDCAALFVRDLACSWYQYTDGSIGETVKRIHRSAEHVGADRIICLGNSMGGFGAILFGHLAGAHAVLAFSAQTAISPEATAALGDFRWTEYQSRIASYPHGDLASLPPPARRTTLCYGDQALDVAHAERLPLDWGSERIVVKGAGHAAAKHMKARGDLIPLLLDVVNGP